MSTGLFVCRGRDLQPGRYPGASTDRKTVDATIPPTPPAPITSAEVNARLVWPTMLFCMYPKAPRKRVRNWQIAMATRKRTEDTGDVGVCTSESKEYTGVSDAYGGVECRLGGEFSRVDRK